MSFIELFPSKQNVFSRMQKTFEKAKHNVFGVPFVSTSSHRNGARFGPTAIRQASLNIETCSFRADLGF
jgi:arginase family enzyme